MIFLATFFTSPGFCAEKALVFATTNLPPVVNQSGDGYLDKVFDELFARAGRSYNFEATPGARALAGANAGFFDGDAARIATVVERYPNLVAVPEPVISVTFAGVTLDQDIEIRTVGDFGKYSVGYIRGWKMAEKLFSDHNNIEVVRSADLLIKMLAQGRIDVAFLTVAPAFHTAKNNGIIGLQVSEYRITQELVILLNKKHADFAPLLDSLLKSMKQDGSYDAIMAGYSPEDR